MAVGSVRRCVHVASAMWLILALAGCRASESADGQAVEPIPWEPLEAKEVDGPVDRSRDFRAMVKAEGTGAAPFRWEGEQVVSLIRVGDPELSVNIVSAQVRDPQQLTDDPAARFRWGFDLFGDYDDEPGDYTFDGSPTPNGKRSAALLVWMRVKDGSKPAVFSMDEVEFMENFTELREPCTVTLGPLERTGALRCPAVANENGEVAGFTVSWEELGEVPPATRP